jgi:FAD/FMN-containing dehydrogenase
MIYAGMLIYPGFMAGEVARGFRDYMATAPDEVGGGIAFMTAPPEPFVPEEARGKPVVGIIATYAGDPSEGERVLAPLRAIAEPAVDLLGPMPYTAAQQLIEPGNQPGHRHYWKADLIDDLSDEAIDSVAAVATRTPSPLTVSLFQPLGGAIARVPADATALGRRDAGWAYHALAQWDEPADDVANIAWARELAASLEPYTTGGVYITWTVDSGDERVRDAYRGHYDRLVAVKDRYDPGNMFRLGQNIRPSAAAAAAAERP